MEKFVCVLFFGCDEIFKGFLFWDLEFIEDIGCCIVIGVFYGVKVLKYVIYGVGKVVGGVVVWVVVV